MLKLLNGLKNEIPKRSVAYFSSGSLHKDYQATGANLIEIDRGDGNYLKKFNSVWHNLRDRAAQCQPDIIHSQLPQTNLLTSFALKSMGVPIILSERGVGRTRPFWEKALRSLAYSRVDAFVTNSKVTRKRMINREKLTPSQVRIIPNIVDLQIPLPESLLGLRKKLGLPENSTLITAVGGLRQVKGYDVLLDAFAILHKTHDNINLLIVGEGPERQLLEKKINSLQLQNSVCLSGYRDDIADILAISDIYISSSFSEGQSNSILEAMASSLPIIGTAVGGTPDLLRNGEAGILVPPRDSKAIAKALDVFLKDESERDRLAVKSEQYISTAHSSKSVADEYVKFYHEVIAEYKRKHA
ncbi:MAG: glycosyltransferase family 4 protein [Candidatus Sabulitectum sp.]|nr:glycosyltransferase family 4 protein [Candidatus Sabulitectum sp.]